MIMHTVPFFTCFYFLQTVWSYFLLLLSSLHSFAFRFGTIWNFTLRYSENNKMSRRCSGETITHCPGFLWHTHNWLYFLFCIEIHKCFFRFFLSFLLQSWNRYIIINIIINVKVFRCCCFCYCSRGSLCVIVICAFRSLIFIFFTQHCVHWRRKNYISQGATNNQIHRNNIFLYRCCYHNRSIKFL